MYHRGEKQSLLPIETGISLSEITDSNQIPDFKDDYDEITLLYAIDNSREYFKKVKSYPDAFKSIGLPVTPMRSIATGEGFFPPGGLAFAVMETEGQVGKSFFVLGHDIRSAINTAARIDVYCGIGKDALQKAENLNTNGKLYYLLKR